MYLHCLGCQAKEYDYNLCAECYRCASHRSLPAFCGSGWLSRACFCGSYSDHARLFVRRSRRHATDEKHHHRSHRFQLRWRYSQPDDVQKLAQEYADMPVD